MHITERKENDILTVVIGVSVGIGAAVIICIIILIICCCYRSCPTYKCRGKGELLLTYVYRHFSALRRTIGS